MRMKQSRLYLYTHKSRIVNKSSEGSVETQYGEPTQFLGEVWNGGGKVQAEIYGEKLSYVRNIRISGKYVITTDRARVVHYVYPTGLDLVENDGLCLYVDDSSKPDYRINAIKPYTNLMLEAVKL